MIITAVVAVGVAASTWLVAPFVSMARRGTLDDQARAAMRAEADRADAVRRAHRRATLVAVAASADAADAVPAPVSIPRQRRSPVIVPVA